ncbi:MAG TPA: glycoside hydrolase family 2 TIM barrel-domain containing protein [Puia sp.]|uniref:glycoside hydrolase family 2 protein n=1 Tax=Puia sp. TaxID=2045100 RepID=UPI002BFE4357|nr:glycoside hydrolase family 2 TIM barrel-domain containing protein [Puia sp.]HVU98301.1 glycoside hydrolase family 2 TIM barrel-domain containing protein [Puia sp.]
MNRIITIALICIATFPARAQETQKLYLSGTGNDHTVDWKFFCTEGRNSGKWTTIPVPSNWELQGFGKYNYGLDKDSVRGHEKGLYKYNFTVPAAWKGREVDIVFDGSMTDTEVKLNGKSAGPTHQGSFYRFRYNITGLLRYGRSNLLEVTVAKESGNKSVNMAERHCDFWIFGGIFRPVYLEAVPIQHIAGTAIDAKADGFLRASIRLAGITGADHITAQAYSLINQPLGQPFTTKIYAGDTVAHLQSNFDHPLTWTPEAPNLYKLVFTLFRENTPIHTVEQRFGFRTVELRVSDGIYVNGVKIKFKGICRHSFWPGSGRALNKNLSIEDVQLMKDMNMNAVRMSHYPPDDHFLDACDSLGLFVLDELTGWHHAYDTEVGSKLVKEMIEKDVNHPSIVVWDNGNEGGFNFDLDPLFDKLDPQHRPLIHPWALFRHLDTQHYINYNYGNGACFQGHEVFFPTEFLHGLYDGGHGAGLYDYWELMVHNPLSAGGFLWDFSDEAVVRTDRNGELDADKDHGPDGILGPYREKEGSFYAVKEIWCPVHIPRREITNAFDGTIPVGNRFIYTNLRQCHFSWRLSRAATRPAGAAGEVPAPDVRPGQMGTLNLALPSHWQDYDILSLTAKDPGGRELYTWTWPIATPAAIAARLIDTAGSTPATANQTDSLITLTAAGITASFGKATALLRSVNNSKGPIPFTNGPTLTSGEAVPSHVVIRKEGNNTILEATYPKPSVCQLLRWTMYPSGWLKMELKYYPPEYDYTLLGASFSYPEKGQDSVKGVRWLGDGPYRVWKNRTQGVTLDIWDKAYNNTITGQGKVIYPEFKGYFSNFYWMRLETARQPFTVACADKDVYLRLFTPGNPLKTYNVAPPFPEGDISFMHAIPPIGTKSQKPENMGPSGARNMYYDYTRSKDYAKSLTLYFDFSGK